MSRSKVLAAALCALTVASCGNAREASRVGIEKDQTSITFGFTPAKVNATAPLPGKAALGQPAAEPDPFPLPTATFSPAFRDSSRQFSSGPCPSASPGTPVSSRSSTQIKGRPPVGTYKWLGSGKYLVSTAKIPLAAYFGKYVLSSQTFTDSVPRNAGQAAGDNFTFASLEPRIGGGFWRFGWQVKTDPGVAQDPEGGLVIKAVELAGEDGKAKTPYFRAQGSGLLMAPFPIKPGQTWTSTSVDVSRQKTMQLSGQMLKREVIDVCGTLVEGWHVHATLSDAGRNGTLDYLIGTQYGGMVVALALDGFYLETTYERAATRMGQVVPKPLPKGVQ